MKSVRNIGSRYAAGEGNEGDGEDHAVFGLGVPGALDPRDRVDRMLVVLPLPMLGPDGEEPGEKEGEVGTRSDHDEGVVSCW